MVQSEENSVWYVRTQGKQEINVVLRFPEFPYCKAKADLVERLKELYLRKLGIELTQREDISHE